MSFDLLYLVSLAMIPGIGPVKARNLISFCGSPEEVFQTSKAKLLRIPGIGPETANLLRDAKTMKAAERELNYCHKKGIRIISYLDYDYPSSLKSTFDGPLILYQKGPVNLNDRPGIGIVGTRKASPEGREIASRFGEWFAARDFNVVSGLAYGIDIAAHSGALKQFGVTTAVLGHGLDRVYPASHSGKASQIADSGALLSEFPLGTLPDAKNFPARNRIISGLCRAIIVVEATETGGALITARFAFDQNREVYAVPGDLTKATSIGCNRLIRDQIAKLITDPQEVLDDLNLEPVQSGRMVASPEMPYGAKVNLSPEESKLTGFLANGDAQLDFLAENMGLLPANLSAILLGLEFKGVVTQMPGRKFRLAVGC
ncbi:MAG: DNA-protecting protein DprA [Bacteroidia bacterium]|nr:DNA-protecting protein DprA [Bacteroidia bacterium]